jgi:hypothetical protein
MTAVGVRFQDEQLREKMLPCLTVCPMNAFKSTGFYFTVEEYYNQTYNMDEIFYYHNMFDLMSDFHLTIEELRGIYTGRCYMVCPKREMPKRDFLTLPIWKFGDIKGFQFLFSTLDIGS